MQAFPLNIEVTIGQWHIHILLILTIILVFTGGGSGSSSAKANNKTTSSQDDHTRAFLQSEFDWRAYYEIYPDLASHHYTREQAINHYIKLGAKENRRFPKLLPQRRSLKIAWRKLKSFVKELETEQVPLEERYFVSYYISDLKYDDFSLEVAVNNLRIFNHSICYQSMNLNRAVCKDNPNCKTFYWFHVIKGIDNVLKPYIPMKMKNVAMVYWDSSHSDIFTHFRSLSFMRLSLQKFGTIVFLNQDMRGPLHFHESARWIKEYQQVLNQNDNGIVAEDIECDSPKLQLKTDLFAIRHTAIPLIVSHFMSGNEIAFPYYPKKFPGIPIRKLYDIRLVELFQQNGYNISSFVQYQLTKKVSYDGTCLVRKSNLTSTVDTEELCDLTADEPIFMRWGSHLTTQGGFPCQLLVNFMSDQLTRLQNNYPDDLQLFIPETLKGGLLLHLYKDHEHEMWLNKQIPHLILNRSTMNNPNIPPLKDKVCFLVRSCDLHDPAAVIPEKSIVDRVVKEGIDGFIRSLLRQSDPNWEAFFFNTDVRPFEQRLQEILYDYSDIRLTFIDVPLEYRPPYSSLDAGYTTTDYVMRRLLLRDDCRWLSATNADNIYGSGVVESVRRVVEEYSKKKTHPLLRIFHSFREESLPDMMLAPLDTRNFANQDHLERKDTTSWNGYCEGLLATFKMHELGYTVQPRPALANVDLAAVFFSRPKLLSERVFFGNFTDPDRFPCKGCQDGYFTEYLARNRLWRYERLPIGGMRSTVFHGPSLTWCLAAGNVWFDHPDVSKVRCYSPATVHKIRELDNRQSANTFDWTNYDSNNQLCLRFSEMGYNRYQGGNGTV